MGNDGHEAGLAMTMRDAGNGLLLGPADRRLPPNRQARARSVASNLLRRAPKERMSDGSK